MNAPYRDLTFPSADGRLTLYARDYPGEGPALLMMHGLTRNSADFEGLADHLAGRFRLVIPDQRGRGRSDRDPDPACYAVDRYCADMLALIQRLELDRPILLGTSMGGLMALAMGSIGPDRYRAIILNDVGPEVEAEGLARIGSYVGRPVNVPDWAAAADHCRTINGAAFPRFGEQEWQTFAKRIFSAEPDGSLSLAYDPAIAVPLSAPQSPAPDLWPLWRQLDKVPMLVVRGELSDVLSAQTVARMQETHSDLQVCTVPGVGHAPMLDEPEAIDAIELFLAGLERTAA
jgi:pimeloyl-ACP methyl ester carboxylesterase